MLRRDPQVLQLEFAAPLFEGVETAQLLLEDRRVDLVFADEPGGDGKGILPLLDPSLGVAPVALRRKRYPGEGVGVVRLGVTDLHAGTPGPHLLHSRETDTSTLTGTFSRISSPARIMAFLVLSETCSEISCAHSTTNSSWMQFMRRASSSSSSSRT